MSKANKTNAPPQLVRPCHGVIQQYMKGATELPVLLFESENCQQGVTYPGMDEVPLWEQPLTHEHVQLSRIGSMFIPPHAYVYMTSTKNQMIGPIMGPAVIDSTTQSIALQWPDSTEAPKFTFGDDLASIRLVRHTSWPDFLHSRAATQHPEITIGPLSYTPDYDSIFAYECSRPSVRPGFRCNCWDTYIELKQEQPAFYKTIPLNLHNPECNPRREYVPHDAVALLNPTPQDCHAYISSQIKSGAWLSIDQGGPTSFVCAGKHYANSYSNGSKTSNKSLQEKPQNNLIEAIVLSIVSFLLLMFAFYWIYRSQQRRLSFRTNQESILNTPDDTFLHIQLEH